jgi:hypothetical protein
MPAVTIESSIALEHLDDYLKAIVKVKLREFVHLSPWFQDIPSIDVNNYMRFESIDRPSYGTSAPLEACPNTNRIHYGVRRKRTRAVSFQ